MYVWECVCVCVGVCVYVREDVPDYVSLLCMYVRVCVHVWERVCVCVCVCECVCECVSYLHIRPIMKAKMHRMLYFQRSFSAKEAYS